MDVVKIDDTTFEYRYNNKSNSFNQYVNFTIVDANTVAPLSYPTAGLVWRWTHSDAGSVINFVDVAVGTVGAQPSLYSASGVLGGATNLVRTINNAGIVSTALDFDLIATGMPVQADYITFQNSAGDTFAVNIDIDSNGTLPTGASYLAATNKITVGILSTDTPNQIMSKIVSVLLTNGISSYFTISISTGANLNNVVAGNILSPIGTLAGWSNTNKMINSGDNIVGGYPIVNVGANYCDVVNPNGVAMSSTAIGAGSEIVISSTPIIS